MELSKGKSIHLYIFPMKSVRDFHFILTLLIYFRPNWTIHSWFKWLLLYFSNVTCPLFPDFVHRLLIYLKDPFVSRISHALSLTGQMYLHMIEWNYPKSNQYIFILVLCHLLWTASPSWLYTYTLDLVERSILESNDW